MRGRCASSILVRRFGRDAAAIRSCGEDPCSNPPNSYEEPFLRSDRDCCWSEAAQLAGSTKRPAQGDFDRVNTEPVTIAAASETRKPITRAISSAYSQLPRSASGIASRLAPVSIIEGAMALTVMWSPASSAAND